MATVHIGLTYPDLIEHIAPGDLAERAARRIRRRHRRVREVGRGERDVHVQRPKGHLERTDGSDARQGQGLRRWEVREDREHVPPLV